MTILKLPALLILLIMSAAVAGFMVPRGSTGGPSASRDIALAGTTLPSWHAPGLSLTDQFHHAISLTGYRGRPVLLTFLQANCVQLCPVVAETIRRSLEELGPAGNRVAVLAVSADPEHDTAATVKQFSQKHNLWRRWHYLTGSRAQLTPIWQAYHLFVAPKNAPASLRQAHTSATYLIDGRGRERVLLTGDPGEQSLIRDLRILLGVSVASPISAAVPAPEVGHPAPGFSLTSLDGGRASLQSLHGRVVLLNFWATWCTACRSEMPRLEGWYRKLRGQGVTIVGIDNGESAGTVRDFIRRFHITYPIALDGSGDISARYDAAYFPTTVLIDRAGTVSSYRMGVLDPTYLTNHIAPLLGGSGAR
ncbi:MAG: redoxin domain-containing protein [Chloroflexota bacterium]|nr:redoxin domain-containing protein [Chloroflexota bacterium]